MWIYWKTSVSALDIEFETDKTTDKLQIFNNSHCF